MIRNVWPFLADQDASFPNAVQSTSVSPEPVFR